LLALAAAAGMLALFAPVAGAASFDAAPQAIVPALPLNGARLTATEVENELFMVYAPPARTVDLLFSRSQATDAEGAIDAHYGQASTEESARGTEHSNYQYTPEPDDPPGAQPGAYYWQAKVTEPCDDVEYCPTTYGPVRSFVVVADRAPKRKSAPAKTSGRGGARLRAARGVASRLAREWARQRGASSRRVIDCQQYNAFRVACGLEVSNDSGLDPWRCQRILTVEFRPRFHSTATRSYRSYLTRPTCRAA
jgi:hypothetical protein